MLNIESDYFVANVDDPTLHQLDAIGKEFHVRFRNEYGGL